MRSSSPRNSSHASRSPTPSRSSTPTPTYFSGSKRFYNPIDEFFYDISNNRVLFPIIIILSLILSVFIGNSAPSFCSSDGSQTSYKCKACPDNSICYPLSFKCVEGFSKINNNCVSDEQKESYTDVEELAKNITKFLDKENLEENTINLTILEKELDASPLPIRTAIEFTDYRIFGENETIEKVFDYPSVAGYWFFTLLSLLIILFAIVIIAYRFLRFKNI